MSDETTTYDPSEHTVDEVNAYLDEHPDEAAAVLAKEAEAEKPRTGITEGPHKAVTTEGGAKTVEQAGAEVPQATGEKYEKGYDGFVPSRDGDKTEDLTLQGVLARQSDKDA